MNFDDNFKLIKVLVMICLILLICALIGSIVEEVAVREYCHNRGMMVDEWESLGICFPGFCEEIMINCKPGTLYSSEE